MIDNWVLAVRSGLQQGGRPIRLALVGVSVLLGVVGGLLLSLVSPFMVLALLAALGVGVAMVRSTQMGLSVLLMVVCLLLVVMPA